MHGFHAKSNFRGGLFHKLFYLRPPKGCTDVFLFRVFMASFSEIKGRDRCLNARGFQSEKNIPLNKTNTILAVCTARESDPWSSGVQRQRTRDRPFRCPAKRFSSRQRRMWRGRREVGRCPSSPPSGSRWPRSPAAAWRSRLSARTDFNVYEQHLP